VEIKANPKLTAATVTIVREAVHGYERSDEAKQSLEDITTSVQIVKADLGQTLQVRTSTTAAEPHFQRTHIRIEAPQIDGVAVHTHNGRVEAIGCSGAADISTDEDEVRVITNQPMLKPVTIVNKNGDINYRVRGESTGRLDCETISGKVVYYVRYGNVRVMQPTDNDTLNATLNNGTNPIRLRTVNGDIKISVVNNPEQVGQFIF
jgi:hypothetical protein